MTIDTTPPRTTGTTHDVQVTYIIYYGAASYRDRKCRTFYDEHSAHKFFTEKLQANLHVSAYKETVKTTRIVERI